jgi:hypothetical protein
LAGHASAGAHDVRAMGSITLGFVAMGLVATVAVELLVGSPASLAEVEFGYGDKIARVMAGEALGDATRLPAIPYALGLFGRLLDDPFAATLAKNLLLLVPLGWVLARVWLDGPRDLVVACGILFLLCFPQLVRHTLSLVPEEGWVIPLIAFAFHAFLCADRDAPTRRLALAPAMVATSTLVLLKSTMLLAAPLLTAMLALRHGRRGPAALAAALMAAAILGLSALHLTNSGRFTPTSSLSGYDLWKGNNVHALAHFPDHSLDAISHLAPAWEPGIDEWQWHRLCIEEARRFWHEHPVEAVELTRRKFVQVFLRVGGEISPSDYTARELLKPAGIAWMVGFRIALWLALAIAVATLIRAWRGRDTPRDAVVDAIGFLALVAALAAPFLIAWGTERRLMPIVIPVFLYLWSVWRRHRERSGQRMEARS